MTKYKEIVVNRKPEVEYWTVKDLKKLLSYGADIVCATSPRNCGKSYSAMELCYESISKGGYVAWGRYNKVELGQAVTSFKKFAPDMVKFETEDSTCKGLVDPATGGKIVFFPWNRSQNIKGLDFPFDYMVCDEFIPERYTEKTRLDTEFADWNSVYLSLARNNHTKVIMLANCIYWQNPFYLQWGIPPFSKGKILIADSTFSAIIKGKRIETKRRVVCENVAMTEGMIERNLKQIAVGFGSSEDMQHYLDNVTKAEYTTIGQCPVKSIQLENIQLMSDGYYMGFREYDGKYYFVKVKPDYSKETAVSEPSYIDFSKNQYRTPRYNQFFEEAFNSALCVFDTAETLNAFLRWLRHNRGKV